MCDRYLQLYAVIIILKVCAFDASRSPYIAIQQQHFVLQLSQKDIRKIFETIHII